KCTHLQKNIFPPDIAIIYFKTKRPTIQHNIDLILTPKLNDLNKDNQKLVLEYICRDIESQQERNYWSTITKLLKYKFHNITQSIETDGKYLSSQEEISQALPINFKNIYTGTESRNLDGLEPDTEK
ncbi:hypothetical protein HHI36_020124, partial [Cryptolaemus montrouzieri]